MQSWLERAEAGALGNPTKKSDREVVFERHDPARDVFLVREGAVEIFQRTAEGFSTVVKILAAPSLFGHGEALSDEALYLESTRLVGDGRLHRMDKEKFIAMVKSDAALGYECLVDTCAMFMVSARFEPARMLETEALLANLLLSYAAVAGRVDEDGVRLELRRTQDDLAQAIGAAERSVNRVFARWKRDDLVIKKEGKYTLRSPRALVDIAGELLGSLTHPKHLLESTPWWPPSEG